MDFENIFTHDRIKSRLQNGEKIELKLVGEKIMAVSSSGDNIEISEMNLFRDYMEYTETTFRKSVLKNAVEAYENSHINAEKFDLLYCANNFASEASEVNKLVLRKFFFNKKISIADMISEQGDSAWYFSHLMRFFNFRLIDVLKTNIIKLNHRFPTKSHVKLERKNEGEELELINNYLKSIKWRK